MTTTAKQSSSSSDVRRNSPSSSLEAAEDIESIAKQISDHAEAIYQEWKARGLAPTEILKCHPETDNSFNKTLSSQVSPSAQQSKRTLLEDQSLSSTEILSKAPDLSANNLNQLVNSFVNEDKARIAAQRSDPSGGSTIKNALKKFESLTERSESPVSSSSSHSLSLTQQQSQKDKQIVTSCNNNNSNLDNNIQTQQYQVPDVLKDTIEKCAKRQKPETPVKPDHLLNHVPTWPFKQQHRIVSQSSNNFIDMKTPTDNKKNSCAPMSSSSDKPNRKTIDVMDEVSREEEKLINALKTGTVLTNDLPEVITSSLNDYKTTNEQQLNGITTVIKENRKHDIRNEQNNESESVSSQNPPQKPNHTPIYVPPKEDTSKGFSSFARVSTTRIPRNDLTKLDEKKFELKSIPSPVRPFLSRGSVAERVLIFEKCPEKAPARQTTEKPKIQVILFL